MRVPIGGHSKRWAGLVGRIHGAVWSPGSLAAASQLRPHARCKKGRCITHSSMRNGTLPANAAGWPLVPASSWHSGEGGGARALASHTGRDCKIAGAAVHCEAPCPRHLCAAHQVHRHLHGSRAAHTQVGSITGGCAEVVARLPCCTRPPGVQTCPCANLANAAGRTLMDVPRSTSRPGYSRAPPR
jgi:hypothetical protein